MLGLRNSVFLWGTITARDTAYRVRCMLLAP